MSNKYLQPDYSTFSVNKLNQLAEKLQLSFSSLDFYSSEQYLEEAIKVLTNFYKTIGEPIEDKNLEPIYSTLPDLSKYNAIFTNIQNSFNILFLEFENIEDVVIANFNNAVTESTRLKSYLKRISSLIGDFSLYTDTTVNTMLFRDSFIDFNKIDINSSLLNKKQCSVNDSEGILTLPIDLAKDSQVSVRLSPIINPNSNGSFGNNWEIGVDLNNDILAILDNNPDTWFEYEKVVKPENDTGTPLVLDLTLNLENPKIINNIRINPNNFGVRTSIKIDTIETSTDGIKFINVKDDIPIEGYLVQDEENVFTLAPSTSKYSGQGVFTFTPRKAKYIHFIFSQIDAYSIDTPSGTRNRYAIGIRDIELKNIKYFNEGEIISNAIEPLAEISKVAIKTTQDPVLMSELASVKHYISPDDGISWLQIQPQKETGTSGVVSKIPEIINFNNAGENSINTSVPVYKLRWKGVLNRNDSVFEAGTAALYKTVLSTTELKDIPLTAPHSFSLQNTPIDGTVQIVDPMFGSCGLPQFKYKIGIGEDSRYYLPNWGNVNEFRPLEITPSGLLYEINPVGDSDWINLYVGNKKWETITDDLSSYGSEDLVYKIEWASDDSDTLSIQFGDGTTGGATPLPSEKISMYFEAEKLFPVNGKDYPTKINFPTSSEKKMVTIERIGQIKASSMQVPRNAVKVILKHQNIIEILTDMTGLTSKTFINGKDEFTTSSQYSLDSKNGILYLSAPGALGTKTTLSYSYQPIYKLTETDWDWGTTNNLRDSILIHDSGWESIPFKYELSDLPAALDSDTYTFQLPYMAINKKSLKITCTTSGTNPFTEEVPFVDGITELESKIEIVQQIGQLNSPVAYIHSITLDEVKTDDPITFTERGSDGNPSYFITEKETLISLSSDGDYYIDESGDQAVIKLYYDGNISDAGDIIYFKTGSSSNNGYFSINYNNGTIYTQLPIDSGEISSLVIEGEYTNYRIKYSIARLIDPGDYSVSYSDKTIQITNANQLFVKEYIARGGSSKFHISYDYIGEVRDNIQELKDSFTPVLKDYMLKLYLKEE